MAAVILEKEGLYWLYHKTTIEDDDEEKMHPAEKIWKIVKFQSYEGESSNGNKGYRIRIGDTIKFGRVRFKVIMMHNERDGDQIYKENKFSKKEKPKRRARRKLRSSLGNTHSDDEMDEEEEDISDEMEDEDEEDDEEEEMDENEFGDMEDNEVPRRRALNPLIENENLI